MIEGIIGLIVAMATLIVKRAINHNTETAVSVSEQNRRDHQRVINALVWTQQTVIENGTKLDTFIEEHDKAHRVINDRLNIR